MREFLDLANNPLFVKHVRSRLRRSSVLPGMIVIGFLSICILILDAQMKKENAGQTGPILFFILQSLILMLIGGSQVASAVAHVKDSGIIDFHRVTPVPASVQTIGFLLGAPIRELVLYSMTLPFSFFCAANGDVGIVNWCKLLLVQLGLAILYYGLAFVTGLSSKSGKGASGRFVAVIVGLNVLSTTVLFPNGVYGPTLLTPAPVFWEVFIKKEEERAKKRINQQMQQQQMQFPPNQKGGPPFGQPQQQQQQRPFLDETREITFFSAPLPIVVQSLLFQWTFLAFLFIAASRRMRSNRLPLYSKPYAILFMTCISFLTLGSVWDAPTLLLVLGSVYFLTFCAIMLTSSITVPLGEAVKGMQRARKLSGSHVPLWSDLSTNKFAVFLFGVIIALTVSLGVLLAPQPPWKGVVQVKETFAPWPPLVTGILTLFTFGYSMQYMQLALNRRAPSFFALLIFSLWLAPLIIGGIMASADLPASQLLWSICTIFGIALAGGMWVQNFDAIVLQLAAIVPSAVLTVVFGLLLINEERKLRQNVVTEHSAKRRKSIDYDE